MTEIWRWKARNTITNELCSHCHHSIESAMRCGEHIFGKDRAEAVRWVEEFNSGQSGNSIMHVQKIHADMSCGMKKKKKKTHPYHFYRKSDLRGIERFDDEDKKT